MRLTRVLTRQDHEVILWGPASCRERVEEWGGKFELHEPIMPRVVGPAGHVAELAVTTERLTAELVPQLFPHQVDLLIHDGQTPWARVAGDYLGIPRIVSHPMFPIVAARHIPSATDRAMPTPDPEEAKARFGASWLAVASRWGIEFGSAHNVIHSSAEVKIAYTTERIMGDYPIDPGWHFVGPLMDPPPPRAPAGPRPLVYVCFGTKFNERPELFEAVIRGLADEPVDVLVSTGRGIVSAVDIDPLPANVTLREFVPAREVLARASVHITHGGCNSVHETLLAGVPMVCMPQAFDQFPLAQAVEQLGAGVLAEEQPDEIRRSVQLLLGSEKALARANEVAEHLAGYDGERRLADLLDRVLDENAALTA
jgi:demethyllactenocin mycarosyltransferase